MTNEQMAGDFDKLCEIELGWIADRRRAFGPVADIAAPVTGLALSGGGIRSATFSLGFLQGLSAAKLIPKIDYISTVSGGSYIGSFFGALFVPETHRGNGEVTGRRLDFDPEQPLQSKLGIEAVRKLREAGRYLTPGGTSDAFFGAAVVLRNWAAVQFVIGMAALLLFWSLTLVDVSVTEGRPGSRSHGFSSALGILAIGALGFVLASGSAYWLTRRDWIPGSRLKRALSNGFFLAMIATALYFASPWWKHFAIVQVGWLFETSSVIGALHEFGRWAPVRAPMSGLLALIATSAILLYAIAETWVGDVRPPDDRQGGRSRVHDDLYNPQLLIAAEDRVRSKLSAWMSTGLMAFVGIAGLFIIDWLGQVVPATITPPLQKILRGGFSGWDVAKLWPGLTALVPPLLSYLASSRLKDGATQLGGSWIERHMPVLLALGGLAALSTWLILWSAVAHVGIAQLAGVPAIELVGVILEPAIMALILLIVVNIVLGMSFSFINLSSLSTFYAARLRRAYIGASSADRTHGSVRDDEPQDTIRLDRYYEGGRLGKAPLHLINVTIAETMTGDSNLVARDRKGKPMHLSPAGIVYEGARPGLTLVGKAVNGRFRHDFGEELPLANWIAISGAAVSAAIGSGTSLGTSIFATLGNVRLGYWWKKTHARAGKFSLDLRDFVQNYLLLELRGAFAGTARPRWYLTDGGHFENSGAYALLQRHVPFIVICDNGADPDYRMADIVRLLGRARTDLGVEIDFLGIDDLKTKFGADSPLHRWIGSFESLAVRGHPGDQAGPVAALAKLTYPGHGRGSLLLVKPRLLFDEPPDVLAYQAGGANADFPQQTTADQFFDEEQWEAYRRLGELTCKRLFCARKLNETGWFPIDMKP